MWACAALGFTVACGAEATVTSAPAFEDVALPVVEAGVPPDLELALPPAATTVGVTGEGALVAASVAGLEAWDDGTWVPLPLFTAAPDVEAPATDVRSVVPRVDGGAWILADTGLYRTTEGFHVLVDPSIDQGRLAFPGGAAPFDGVWIATPTDLLQLSAGGFRSFSIPHAADLTGLATAVDGREVGLLGSDGVQLLRPTADAFELQPTMGPIEAPRAIAHHDGQWWVAGASLHASAEPETLWTRHPLPEAATQLATGPDGALWFAGRRSVYAVVDGAAERRFEAPVGCEIEQLLSAPGGDLWARCGERAFGWRAGPSGPSFAQDVLPWLEANGCVACHAAPALDFRIIDDFRSVASDALSRVASGDMPRCANGPCPPDEQLTPEAYAILGDWIEGGMMP